MEALSFIFMIAIWAFILFEDEISDLVSALSDRIRGDQKVSVTRYRIERPDKNVSIYRRKINDGPWEDLTPEEWEDETITPPEFNAFNHWRIEYADERKQRSEGDRKYGD